MRIVFIIIMCSLTIFAQTKFIKWDSVGQRYKLNKSEKYSIIYGNANPEDTRINYYQTPNENEFILELGNSEEFIKKKTKKESDSNKGELRSIIEELNTENKFLLKRLADTKPKKNDIKLEKDAISDIPTNMVKISPKIISSDDISIKNLYSEDYLDKVNIKNTQNTLDSILNKMESNSNEYSNNYNKIQEIREKIIFLKNNNGSISDIKDLQNELESLLAKNISLQEENRKLFSEKESLIRDNLLKAQELENEKVLRYYFIAVIILILMIAIVYYISYKNKKRANVLLDKEQKKSEKLLHNILPVSIANRLKKGEMIADNYTEASVIFIDIVGFTKLSNNIEPTELLTILNEIFTIFDKVSSKYGLEKIKTIGDCYMAASGVPKSNPKHLENIIDMAIESIEILKNYKTSNGLQIAFRAGIETGPVVAGVIGKSKFIYDLWGDSVNVASRMEETSEANQIQCTSRVKELASSDRYLFKQREAIHIKGKGKMQTYFIEKI